MSVIRRTIFSPVVTASILYVLARGPESLRRPLINLLSSEANVERAKSVLKWLLALGIIRRANTYLNSWAENGWQALTKKGEWNWNREIAVITGGANGIGAGVVKGLAAKGVKCVVLDIAELPANMQNYANITYHQVDITSREAVFSVAKQIQSTLGNPTILVNNAGIAQPRLILETEPEALQRLYSVNVFAHYNTLQAFLPSMISANKGHVVTIASLSSFVPPAGLVDYASTKTSIMSLHEGLTSELRHRYNAPNVKTSIVHPTYVRTRLLGGQEERLKKNGGLIVMAPEVSQAIVKQILSGRGARVIVPERLGIAKAVRGLPTWLQELIRDRASSHTKGAEDVKWPPE
ncbi:MAG: hypothetical protein M1820_002280 [Bogoriella megaspora]|nr:MAG: hypothetical protein M1820_002280 [Bogoriella megaspora]